ncbi:hypothetical protein [Ureibacillus sinduriensis]|uniref:Uncharacterized protein n=1 Tax=Ureibacillus sinduriensis BLB-1 = JCM 15800 TaxID=1384057 RepID=A0A0A3HV63_9BACL|nr:hypothetical protein [Ureibacillus sinduriensis]KGR76299.1 hypothetical protein CD33_07070 [Ureibacillus sinduriensis BLB-1 = JCM 15800]
MQGFIRYQFISYIRSLKIIPPATVFCVWLFLLYAYSNVPILSSYAVSSMAIYLVMTWLTMNVFSIEEEIEKNMLFVQLTSKTRYLFGKWGICLLFAVLFMALAILYPIVMGSFKGPIRPIHIGLSIYSHLILAWFGILIGTIFSVTSFATKKYSWLSALLVLTISLSYEGLSEKITVLKWLLLLFPPVTHVLIFLKDDEITQIDGDFLQLAIWVFLYSVIGTIVVVRMFLRKER